MRDVAARAGRRRPAGHPLPRRRRLRRRQHAGRRGGRAPPTSRARSTATASAAATRTSSRSSRTSSSSSATAASTTTSLARLTEVAHFADELLNFTPDPDQPYVGRNAFAHKGGMHVAGVNADPATFEHLDPDRVGNARELLVSELSGKGTVGRARRGRRPRARRRRGAAGRSTASRSSSTTGYHFEAADGSFELLLRKETGELRAAVPPRVVARDRREARRRQGRDRGHDQDLGRRRALRAHGGGKRSRQRARQGAALGDRGDPPAPRRHRRS